MRKTLILAATLGTMVVSSAAFAAGTDTTGVIKTIDTKAHSITLADGKSYLLPAGFKIQSLKAGEKVAVVWTMKNKEMVASSVKAAY